MKEDYLVLNTEELAPSIGEYSNGLVIPVGEKKLILLTGQVATDKNGKVVYPHDAAKQMEYIFHNIQELLSKAGADIDDIIKIAIFLTDMSDFNKISPIRNKYLKKCRPVSTLLEINKTAVEGCLVEVVITALK